MQPHTHLESSTLTGLILEYQRTKSKNDYHTISDRLLLYFYEFPELISLKNKDHGANFVIFMSKKIPTLVNNFKYIGTPFEGYLYSTCKGQFYTYIRQYNEKEKMNKNYHSYHNYRVLEIPTFVCEDPPSFEVYQNHHQNYLISIEDIIKKFQSTSFYNTFCNRIWLYILKHSVFLMDERIHEISSKVGIKSDACAISISKLSEARYFQKQRYNNHEQLCVKFYAKSIEKSQILYDEGYFLTSTEKEKIQRQLKQSQQLYRKTLYHFQNMSFSISNSVLAKCLNMSKGSIDSSLYQFKKLCRRILS